MFDQAVEGSCRCKSVRFRVLLNNNKEDCLNRLSVHKNQLQVISGSDMLQSYAFSAGFAKHFFCKNCGIHPFYVSRYCPNELDINVLALDFDNEKKVSHL
jgi:hypothetical protein